MNKVTIVIIILSVNILLIVLNILFLNSRRTLFADKLEQIHENTICTQSTIKNLKDLKADNLNQFILFLNNSYFKRMPNGTLKFIGVHTDFIQESVNK